MWDFSDDSVSRKPLWMKSSYFEFTQECYLCFLEFSKACLFASPPHNVVKIDLQLKNCQNYATDNHSMRKYS